MGSQRDNNSDVPTEQSTSYFNASFFPESSHFLGDDTLDAPYDLTNHFDEGAIAAFQTPQSYENLRKQTDAQKHSASMQGLILGSTSAQYQPYYPTEEVPITEGLGTDLINWKLCSHTSASNSGTRSQSSCQRTSKNGGTPPTVCETATIVNGGAPSEVELNDDIDLEEVRKQDFTYLPRFNKQRDIIKHFDNAAQAVDAQGQYPSVASTSDFFPAWEIQNAQNGKVEDPAFQNMQMQFAYDADSTVSKSQTQSSVFTGNQRRASGTAPSVTSFTESSIADSAAVSDRFKLKPNSMVNYPKFLEDDGFSSISGYTGYNSLGNDYQYPAITPDLQQVLDTALVNFETSISAQAMPPPPLQTSYLPYQQTQNKRQHSFSPSSSSPSSPPSKRCRPKKDHVCPNCNANFTEKTNLTRHVKSRKCTRTGPDMFFCPCENCPRSYEGRSDNLKTHMKRVHKKEWNRLKSYQGDWREKSSLQGWLALTA